MKPNASLLICTFLFFTSLCAQRTQTLFDDNWKFYKGNDNGAEQASYNDKNWRIVYLPHDWSIEDLPAQSDSVAGPFTSRSIGNTATGYVVGGIGWYRKHFATGNTNGGQVTVYFDGVYMNSDVWINGHHLGNHPYGYTPFYYNITPYLNGAGKENTIAVRVQNEGRNSRWYSGSGIYRHVWLITTSNTHIAQWGVQVSSNVLPNKNAAIRVKAKMAKQSNTSTVVIKTSIKGASGKMVSTNENKDVKGDSATVIFNIANPHLWSPDSPYLYAAVTELWQDGKKIDEVTTPFGIRSLSFSADKGFLLNGKKTLLYGGCVHHDNGLLGSAAIDRAEERRIELLKAQGYNAVRTSHNPPSAAFLDACDRLGMLVIDEAFDQWQREKNPQDYHLYFDTCWRNDIDAMIRRDYNHPSVIFWSIGNEINERADSSGLRIAKDLRNEVKHLDTTRPVTEAVCFFWDHPTYRWDTTAATFAVLDVGGYNYQWKEYQSDHTKYPDRMMMGTESFPVEAYENWQQVETHPYVIGDFVWTAMDYLGETGIGHTELDSNTSFSKTWPWFNSWCGDIDIIGDKKPQSYYRDVVWKRSKLQLLVHAPIPEGHTEAISYWGWPEEYPSYTFPGSEGKTLQVHIYTQYSSVRLALNNKTIGEQNVPDSAKGVATFTIPYQPGILTAYGLQNGKAVDSIALQTAGKPAAIRLTADRKTIHADRNDLSYITAEIVDANGIVVPVTKMSVKFSVEGNAIIKATGSASPDDVRSFQQPLCRTYRGKCLAIVQPDKKGGMIKVKAEAEGLPTAFVSVAANR